MTATDSTLYPELPGLNVYYFEDSFVRSLRLGGASIDFDLDAVLTPGHPEYHPPPPNEQHCYRTARLSFPNPRRFEFIQTAAVLPAIDVTGERDLGNIDGLTRSGDRFRITGEWGVLEVESDPPTMTLTSGDIPER